MLVIKGSKMRTFGPKSGAAAAPKTEAVPAPKIMAAAAEAYKVSLVIVLRDLRLCSAIRRTNAEITSGGQTKDFELSNPAGFGTRRAHADQADGIPFLSDLFPARRPRRNQAAGGR